MHNLNALFMEIVAQISSPERLAEDLTEPARQAGPETEISHHLTHRALVYGGLSEAWSRKKLELRLNLAPDLPLVNVARNQLEQVIVALLTNAAEAIETNEGTVVVTTKVVAVDKEISFSTHWLVGNCEPAPGHYVALIVCDSGVGIDESVLDYIFQPFFSTRAPGRGLGLSTLLDIVQSHQGSVYVKSQPGNGASFTVLLPKRETNGENAE